jgi:rubrerythrin
LVIAGQVSLNLYRAYEVQARDENLPQIANLFQAMAISQTVMTRNFENLLMKLGGSASNCVERSPQRGHTRQNLVTAIRKEIHETDKRYPEALSRISHEGHAAGMLTLMHAVRAQQMHRDTMQEIYDAARSYYALLKSELQRRQTIYYICRQSGAILMDELPQICPVRGESTASYQELQTLAAWGGLPACPPEGAPKHL